MAISKELLEELASLSKIEIENEEIDSYVQDLEHLDALFQKIENYPFPDNSLHENLTVKGRIRPDNQTSDFLKKELLNLSNHKVEGFYEVPKMSHAIKSK